MPPKTPSIPGFRPLSDQIFVREQDVPATPTSSNHPDVVLIYGWGDGHPKHVAKYADGFQALYPTSRQLIILSPMSKALFSNLADRTLHMAPVINELFPSGPSPSDARTILVHTMSNTGAINYAATINHYQGVYAAPFPHHLVVMDSTPGSVILNLENLKRWSRAMAMGIAKFLPWPFVVTQVLFATFIWANSVVERVLGRESAGGWSRKAVLDPQFEALGARKLYLYSREDDLINYEDIEAHTAEARMLGWEADFEVFEGSGHVQHMRVHGEQYWKAITTSWEKAITASWNKPITV
ncbi:DUF829-domain-containing protein [Pyrenochaeta sp. DS3sAY3a]|nr:DUF829-domain-containing protein [Pyrenochaeta sp. DS3sAY3a]